MYSFLPACYFSSNEYLNNYHTEVYQINACDFDKYKKSFHDLEKEDGIEDIFTPHPTSYNSSGDKSDSGRPTGSTTGDNEVDENKMEYDQNYNQSVRST